MPWNSYLAINYRHIGSRTALSTGVHRACLLPYNRVLAEQYCYTAANFFHFSGCFLKIQLNFSIKTSRLILQKAKRNWLKKCHLLTPLQTLLPFPNALTWSRLKHFLDPPMNRPTTMFAATLIGVKVLYCCITKSRKFNQSIHSPVELHAARQSGKA